MTGLPAGPVSYTHLDVYKRQDEEYIVNFSGRYRELHGVTVRTDTPEQFLSLIHILTMDLN